MDILRVDFFKNRNISFLYGSRKTRKGSYSIHERPAMTGKYGLQAKQSCKECQNHAQENILL